MILHLIDLSGILYRHFYTYKSGVRTYESVMDYILETKKAPNAETIVCGEGGNLRRKKVCESYKSNRVEKPKELIEALEAVIGQCQDLGIRYEAHEGYEADDCLATLTWDAWMCDVIIHSQDKDLMQLVGTSVAMSTPKGLVGPEQVREKFGVEPSQIRDLLALAGDTADCVEGCPNVGIGKARDLLRRFDSIEKIKLAKWEELCLVRGIGGKAADSVISWDPEMATRLVTLERVEGLEL